MAEFLNKERIEALRKLPLEKAIEFWDGLENWGKTEKKLQLVVRSLCQADLYYLLVRACKREDMLNQWVFERVREVETSPDGRLDLWARGHYKSSTITFGLTIQDILKNPEITFGIFSHTRPIAKAFLRQIMRELEGNKVLQGAFPDILWGMDVRQAPKWSEDDGIIVRRKTNPPEATIEAWGLVDGQPTSKHFQVLLYDDIVVEGSVSNPDMIDKTLRALEQSYNLSSYNFRRRFAGTRWHFNDAYKTVMDRGTAIPREHPGRVGGTEDGNPVLWSEEVHKEKRKDMGPYTYAAQILLNPKSDNLQGFKREWLKFYKDISERHWLKMNRYLLVDAANSKKKGSDFTAIGVIGLGVDQNYYLLDAVYDRLNLTERCNRVMELHRKWKMTLQPTIPSTVRYETYGMQSDIEAIKTLQESENYRFQITPVGGLTKKIDRIGRLLPIFEQGRFFLPERLYVTDYQKVTKDIINEFVEQEYVPFPVGFHDDFFDMVSRIAEPDLRLTWPKEEKVKPLPKEFRSSPQGWMAA